MGNANNIQITPVNVLWVQRHQDTFDFSGLLGSSVAGKYVTLYAGNNGQGYYAFFDTGSSTDPAPAGLTKIPVVVSATDQPSSLATKFQTAINGVSSGLFTATISVNVVTVKRRDVGPTLLSADGQGANASKVQISMSRRGRLLDLGLLEGDVDLSFEPSNYEVKSHQTGVTPLAALFQGLSTLEVKTTLQETSASQLETLYTLYGGSFTPTNGTKIFGVGSVAQGKNMLTEAGVLVLKPVNATDDTQNFNVMSAIPVPGGLTFSGENPRKLEVTWKGFIEQAFDARANAIAVGDVLQVGL